MTTFGNTIIALTQEDKKRIAYVFIGALVMAAMVVTTLGLLDAL